MQTASTASFELCPCLGAVLVSGWNTVSAAPTHPSDETLLRDAAGQDPRAFEQIYRRHSAALFGLALKILGDRAAAEDVLQEAFLQIWKKAGTFDSNRGQPLGWMIMLTRSRAIDRLRSRQSQRRLAENLSQELPAENHPLADQQAADSEMGADVRRALAALPAEQRAPIELAYFAGLTQTEIADRLGQPLGTVKTRMRAGMLRLREEFRA